MILPLHALGAFSYAMLVNAQYFSQGWKPGQPTTVLAEPSSTAVAQAETASELRKGPLTLFSELFDMSNILKSKPSQDLFALFGINITEKVELVAGQNQLWDDRIPLITDENYNDIIVNESLSPKEEQERVWFLVITSSAMKSDGLSKFMDENFDEAYNDTIIANDLPNVRWGRIDYVNVTTITTKWNVWHAPYLVVLKDRGQTLRFYRAQHLRIRPEYLREFLKQKGWEQMPPWTSSFGPGGQYEHLMNYFAIALASIYNVAVKLPKWLVYLISGSIGSMVISFLHQPAPLSHSSRQVVPNNAPDATPAIATSPSKRSNAKQRKGGKK